jgi:hypothetical protein
MNWQTDLNDIIDLDMRAAVEANRAIAEQLEIMNQLHRQDRGDQAF